MEVRVSKISRLGNFQCMKRKQGENITMKKIWTCNVNYKNLVRFCFEFFLKKFSWNASFHFKNLEVGGGGGGNRFN